MTTEDAFWAAINSKPADSLPRLVFADWLEESPNSVTELGECPKCQGSGQPGWRHRHGKHGPGYYVCEACADIDAGDKRGTGRLSVSHADLAAAHRATADRVPFYLPQERLWTWWASDK